MSYTLATAAKATGLNKSTILRAIKGGQISGTKDPLGEWRSEERDVLEDYRRLFGEDPPPYAGIALMNSRVLRSGSQQYSQIHASISPLSFSQLSRSASPSLS